MITILGLIGAGWPAGILLNWLADVTPRTGPGVGYPVCAYCGSKLPHIEWSGLLSALLWRGKCPQCASPIPWRRLWVELGTMATWALLGIRFDPGLHLAGALFYTAVLIVVTVTDLEHRLIPNRVVYPAIAVALLMSAVDPTISPLQALAGALLGFGLFLVFAIIGRGALGMGDVKLAAFLGAALGLPVVLIALIGGIMLGGVISAALLVTRRVGLKSYIPYGPFLTVAGWIALVQGDMIIRWWFGR